MAGPERPRAGYHLSYLMGSGKELMGLNPPNPPTVQTLSRPHLTVHSIIKVKVNIDLYSASS